jgi:hypothetical protein
MQPDILLIGIPTAAICIINMATVTVVPRHPAA